MLHVVAHAVPGTFLWQRWEEGLALWTRLLALRPAALCLMPDHLHLLADRCDERAFIGALSGYARWRAHRRGGAGGLWLPHPPPVSPGGRLHLQRTLRYILLNPCREGLADDPLAWSLSSHRDCVGLAWPPAVRPAPQPDRFHHYVSADAKVDPAGTTLPLPRPDAGAPGWAALQAAASAVTRTPADSLSEPGHGRQLLIAAARSLGGLSVLQIAARLGLSRFPVHREPSVGPDQLALVARVLGDPRFCALGDGDLGQSARWRRYLAEQPRRRGQEGWMYV
ncbi:MAG: hypothetical protein ABIO70_00705 [Pseudomonadota bacterium]